MTDKMDRRDFILHSAIGATGLAAIAAAQEPKLKVAVITHAGGAHLGAYFRALAQATEVGAVVLCDTDGNSEADARTALGEKLTRFSRDRDALLSEEKPGMALVSVEAKLGPEMIGAALDAGCHVMAEKPACVNAEDFAALVAKADAGNRLVMPALANRVNPEVVEAKRIVAAGEIGKIYGLEMHLVEDQTRLTSPSYQKTWMADKARAGGGHLSWLGIHWLDLGMFITGASVHQVNGFMGNVGGQPINVEDSVAMSMRFDNGTFGTMTSGYYLDKGDHMHLKVWGSQGWLEIDSNTPDTLRWYSAKTQEISTFSRDAGFDPYSVFVRGAVRASLGLEPPPITGAESLRVIKTIHALYRAAETGESVAI